MTKVLSTHLEFTVILQNVFQEYSMMVSSKYFERLNKNDNYYIGWEITFLLYTKA